jgi:aminoglycoside phosphotransferase (APT) family kinase protein
VGSVERYRERPGDGRDREVLRGAVALRDRFQGWCERLAGASVGASLDHNDLHFWNVFVDGDAGTGTVGRVRFYDWGDSVVAHPFASMLIGLGMIRLQLEVGPDDPAVVRPRDAYLEVFGDLAAHAELVEELELACRVGKVGRALSWDRALRMGGAEEAGEFGDAPLRALGSLLSESAITAV